MEFRKCLTDHFAAPFPRSDYPHHADQRATRLIVPGLNSVLDVSIRRNDDAIEPSHLEVMYLAACLRDQTLYLVIRVALQMNDGDREAALLRARQCRPHQNGR